MQSIAGIFRNKLSDHQPYFMIIDTALKKQHPPKFIRIDVQTMKAMIKARHELSKKTCVAMFATQNAFCVAKSNFA